jgi:hypothetical protein
MVRILPEIVYISYFAIFKEEIEVCGQKVTLQLLECRYLSVCLSVCLVMNFLSYQHRLLYYSLQYLHIFSKITAPSMLVYRQPAELVFFVLEARVSAGVTAPLAEGPVQVNMGVHFTVTPFHTLTKLLFMSTPCNIRS